MTAREVGRSGVRKLLQRTGFVDESTTALGTDPEAVTQLLDADWFGERLDALAGELGRDPESVRVEAAGYLREVAASLDERAVQAWRGFSRWLMRAYDVLVDEDQIAQLRSLDRKATLVLDGGELVIEWRESDGHVIMTGPAQVDFTGTLP